MKPQGWLYTKAYGPEPASSSCLKVDIYLEEDMGNEDDTEHESCPPVDVDPIAAQVAVDIKTIGSQGYDQHQHDARQYPGYREHGRQQGKNQMGQEYRQGQKPQVAMILDDDLHETAVVPDKLWLAIFLLHYIALMEDLEDKVQ
jgi:hypothetical protein